MKIYYIEYNYYPLYSGCAIKTGRICRHLQERGYQPTVLTVRYRGMAKVEIVDGIPVARLSSWGRADSFGRLHRATFIVNLLFFLATRFRKFDLLYTSGNDWGIFLAIGLARVLGKGTVHAFSMYGEDNAGKVRSAKLGRVKLHLLKKADRFICSSTALWKDAEQFGIPPDELAWIQNGVDITVFSPPKADRALLRAKHGIVAGSRVLIFLGSVNRRKGVDLLLDAFVELQKDDRRLHLFIVGSDSTRDCPPLKEEFIGSIKARVKEETLEGTVHFTGLLTDSRLVIEYLQLADVFIFPTRMEGSPNALLEAMACGLPCVVTRLEGITDDIIRSGENGILTPPEAPALAEGIAMLLRDPELRRKMGEKARSTIEKDFSFQSFLEKHMALYEKVMRGRKGKRGTAGSNAINQKPD